MTPTQFTTLTPGQHVRITGYTKQGIVLRKSRYNSLSTERKELICKLIDERIKRLKDIVS